MELGRTITLTFIDYSVVFDELSHEFIDSTPVDECGAPIKVCDVPHSLPRHLGLHHYDFYGRLKGRIITLL